jgi:hypothetical protein
MRRTSQDWRDAVDQTRTLPLTLAAAFAGAARDAITPLQHTPWLGRLLAAALLRERGKCRACTTASKVFRVNAAGRGTPRRGLPCSLRPSRPPLHLKTAGAARLRSAAPCRLGLIKREASSAAFCWLRR